MKAPLFSIVTVCYNSEQTIERTIKSVLQQKFLDYEYLIIDGASKDGTLDIIRKYEPLFEGRMVWQSEPDKGIYDAFNKGCKRAQGTYVWIVNSDDFMEPNALVELSEIIGGLDQDKLPVISAAANFVSKEKKEIIRQFKYANANLEHLYKNDIIGVFHPATLVPKAVYEKFGYFDDEYKIIGDVDWFQRAYKNGESDLFFFIENVITNMSDGGVSNVINFKVSSEDRLRLLHKKYNSELTIIMHYCKWLIRYGKKIYNIKFAKH